MFTLLRKLRKSVFSDQSLRKYVLYAFGEVMLVVLGILLALQINNANERKKERALEKEYMVSILHDLSKDRIALEKNVEFGIYPVNYNDSLFAELQKRPLKGREKRIYHFLLIYTNGLQFSYHDRTISQLRNSGGFGLIRNQSVSDGILDYDIHMRESIATAEGRLGTYLINNDIRLNHGLYELYKVQHLKDQAMEYKDDIDRIPYPNDLKLLSYDEYDIQMVLNSMSSIRPDDENKHVRAVQGLEMNVNLDALIRSEYHLP